MKNILKIFGKIAVFTLLLLVTVVGCENDSTINKGEDIILICLGDSLTAGFGATRPFLVDKSNSYPAYLQKKVNFSVINAGVSGDTTAQGLARVDSDVLSKDPDIVIILLGANDVFSDIPISTTQNNLQNIINKVDSGNRKIYLAKFYTDATAAAMSIPSDTITQYNNMFTTLAASSNKITLIEDIWTGVWGIHMSDNIHPNARGYEIMADNIFNAIKPCLQTINNL